MSELPVTPVYGLPHERGTKLPGRSLTGGPTGEDPVLAEKVEDELQRVDGDVSDLGGRVTSLEGTPVPGWVSISHGTGSGSTFLISDIPTGTYPRVRLTLLGSAQAVGIIRVRFNGDNTAGMHRFGILVHDAANNLVHDDFGNSTFWDVAQWGTAAQNTLRLEMFPTDVDAAVAFEATGMRVGGSAATHRTSRSWGRINEFRLLSSIRVSGPTGADFDGTVRWWLDGFVS